MKKSEKTKADIIAAVIKLIEQKGNTDITMSMIAKTADVAVGLINYHYESKQILIRDAVKCYIEEYIKKDNMFIPDQNLSPEETLKVSLISYADFLADHAVLSRLHIKFCLDGQIDAGTAKQAISYYLPIIKKINDKLTDDQVMIALQMISSTIQMSFLESGMAENALFNFFEKEQRDRLIENMISMVIIK